MPDRTQALLVAVPHADGTAPRDRPWCSRTGEPCTSNTEAVSPGDGVHVAHDRVVATINCESAEEAGGDFLWVGIQQWADETPCVIVRSVAQEARTRCTS